MRRRFAMLGLAALGLCAAAALATVPSERSEAASSNATFIVPANDGYGVADCATADCGKVIADQWCLAQGYAKAVEYGFAEAAETTGSVGARLARAATETRPFAITCGR